MMYLIMGFLANYWWMLAALAVGIAAIANPVAVWKLKAWILLGVVAWWGWTGHSAHSAAKVEMMAAQATYERGMAEMAQAERDAARRTREVEQQAAKDVAAAQDEADKRNDQIEADYERRIAGVVDERDRLRQLWRDSEATDRLAEGAAAAGAAAEKDRLRRESAARIVRAVERVQSERDEVIDRYEAVREAINGAAK